MDWTAYVRRSLAAHISDPDEGAVEEMAQHAQDAYAAERADGRPPNVAEAHVRALVDRWCRDARPSRRLRSRGTLVIPPASTTRGLSSWVQDGRYGTRLLWRHWPFTLAAVVTTALGVGAVSTLFSVTYGVLMRPLPWRDAHELVRVWETRDGGRPLPPIITHKSFLQWTASADTITGAAAWVGSARVTVGDESSGRRVLALPVSSNLFPLLGAQPLHGAGFSPGDDRAAKQTVLSYGFWREQFGADPGVVGRAIDIDGESHTIAGVMADGFYFPTPEVRLWLPYRIPRVETNADGANRSISMFNGLVRLAPRRSVEHAAAEATARARGGPPPGMVDITIFGTKGAPIIHALPFDAFIARDVREPLLVLLAAVALLFITAIASVSSLQLARSTARRRELALRAALGAGNGRLARQLLVESTLLGLAGGMAGVIVMLGLHALLPTLLPADFPRASDVALDLRVFGVAVGTALLAGLAFGVLPALQARRLNLVSTLSEDSLAPVGAGGRSMVGRLRALIIAGQVAVATVLLIGAALLGRTFVALWGADRGYEPRGVLTAMLILPDRAFTPATRAAYLDGLLARVAAIPGVEASGFTSILPLSNYEALMGFRLDTPTGPRDLQAGVRTVSADYFRALGISMHAGRAFSASDTTSSDPVAIVNRTFADSYLDGRALGVRLPIPTEDNRSTSVVVIGVIDDVQPSTRGERPRPEIYFNARQSRAGVRFDEPVLVVRTTSDPTRLTSAIRSAIAAEHRGAIVDTIVTMEDRLRSGLSRPRLYAVVLGGFSGLAVLIAATGLFGVLAHGVVARQRELGVRAALGATPGRIVRLVVGQSAVMTLAGLALGIAIAYVAASGLSGVLFGVPARDPWSFIGVPAFLLAVAAASTFIPARRAAAADPLRALKG